LFLSFISDDSSITSEILFTKSIPNIETNKTSIPPIATIIVPGFPNKLINGIVTIAETAPPPSPAAPN